MCLLEIYRLLIGAINCGCCGGRVAADPVDHVPHLVSKVKKSAKKLVIATPDQQYARAKRRPKRRQCH